MVHSMLLDCCSFRSTKIPAVCVCVTPSLGIHKSILFISSYFAHNIVRGRSRIGVKIKEKYIRVEPGGYYLNLFQSIVLVISFRDRIAESHPL